MAQMHTGYANTNRRLTMTTINGTLGQIMTCDVNGVPSFGNLDGGTF